jgi:WD40 repeat protein
MKKIVIVSVIFIMLVLLFTYSIGVEMRILQELTGNIEIVSDYGIRRIFLPNAKVENILEKRADYLINDFDSTPNSRDRVLAVTGVGYEKSRLVMFSPNKDMKLIMKDGPLKPAFSPDGGNIAFLSREHDESPKDSDLVELEYFLYVTNREGQLKRQISKRSFALYKPSWYPDSRRISISTWDCKIYIVNLKTGEENKIIEFGEAPSVSHDGKKIAYLSNEVDPILQNRIVNHRNMNRKEYHMILAEKGAKQKELVELGQYRLKHAIYIYDIESQKKTRVSDIVWIEQPVVWSPDDKYLLYNDRADVSNDIYVLDINSGKKEKISSENGRVMTWQLQ